MMIVKVLPAKLDGIGRDIRRPVGERVTGVLSQPSTRSWCSSGTYWS
jgi:hypothetical protein